MKDVKIDGFDHVDNNSAISMHQEESNTLKLDKLSNRVTIISIIIPCLIGAILIFAYLGMQETVIGVNKEKQSKILEITEQFGAKSNAFDVELAKVSAMLEKKLPEIEKKIKKLEASLAKLSTTKADKKKTIKDIAWLSSQNIKNKKLVNQIGKTGKNNQALINESKTKFETDISVMDKKLKTQFAKMDEYEHLVATTLKNLSILEKKYDEFRKNALTNKTLVTKLDRMNKTFNAELDKLEQKIAKSPKKAGPNPAPKETVPKKITQKEEISSKPTNDKPIVEEALKE
jgi:chromosome segregation ATPase